MLRDTILVGLALTATAQNVISAAEAKVRYDRAGLRQGFGKVA